MKEVFIIGGGSSLATVDFNKLRDKDVIAVNSIYRILPFYPKVIVWSDYPLYLEMVDELKLMPVRKYSSSIRSATGPGVDLISFTSDWTGDFSLRDHLYYGKKSLTGTGAVSLAIALGYERIYLLGYDGPSKGADRWAKYDDSNKERYFGEDLDLAAFVDYDIFNCSYGTSLRSIRILDFFGQK